jgi:diaminobutyrate-2-oxoglutarate transaminase
MSTNKHYISKLEQRESNARSYSRKLPVCIKEADGVYFIDVEGNKILDCLSNAGTLALGHNHPVLISRMEQFIKEKTPFQTLDLSTLIKDKFIDTLFSVLPEDIRANTKIQFCGPSGSDSVEAAIKLCKIATGRETVIGFAGGYHGMSQGSMGLIGNLEGKEKIKGLMPYCHFLPFPQLYRPPFGIPGEEGVKAIITYIENVIADPESGIPKPACIIVEPIQGEGGVNPAPVSFLKELRRICTQYDIPLIFDEIQAGMCRSGKFFSFQYAEGVWPDAITISKAIGGGMPLACVLYNKKLDKWVPGCHAGTFRGNQLAMALGTASLEFMLKEKLWEQSYTKGEHFTAKLKEFQKSVDFIGDVRGRGLMIGVEIINPNEPLVQGVPAFWGELAALIQKKCIEGGLMIEKGGRHSCVLRFLPPLIITKAQIDDAMVIFTNAARTARSQITQQSKI